MASSKIGEPTPVGKVRPVLSVVPEKFNSHDDHATDAGTSASASLIDQIVRDGARRMLAEALQAEVEAYIAQFSAERDDNGRRLVVRNGSHQPREVLTSAGAVEVTAPRVNDRRVDPATGERAKFTSAILPPWCRKTPKINEVLPLLYLHGLSSGDFGPALGQFLGSSAGLSAPVITKLTETWKGRAARVRRPESVRCGRRHGLPNYRLSRYADDWCLSVHGTREDAVALREEIGGVLSTMGLRLSEEKTLITHIDEGLDFLGWRIQRHRKKGADRRYIYTYPAKKALAAVMAKVKMLCRQINTNQPLDALLDRLNPAVQGWCAYFRVGVSSATFSYLRDYLWRSVWRWLRRKHPKSTWKQIRRQYCGGGWRPASLFDPSTVTIRWYRHRGTKIPTPGPVAG